MIKKQSKPSYMVDGLKGTANALLADMNDNVDVEKKTTISRAEMLSKGRAKQDEYLELIEYLGIVNWQLIKHRVDNDTARTTIISRLEKLAKDGVIKKIPVVKDNRYKKYYYASLDYKCSQNYMHDLWLSSVILEYQSKGYEIITGKQVELDKESYSKYLPRELGKSSNIIPDLILIQDGKKMYIEVELHKKYDKEYVKNKIYIYCYNLRNDICSTVLYITDLNRVKKQIEFYVDGFNKENKKKHNVKIHMTTRKEMGVE